MLMVQNRHLLILIKCKGASLWNPCSKQRSVFSAHPWIKSAHKCRQPREPWGTALPSSSHSPPNISLVRLESPTKLLLHSVCSANGAPVITEADVLISYQLLCIKGPILCGMSIMLIKAKQCQLRNSTGSFLGPVTDLSLDWVWLQNWLTCSRQSIPAVHACSFPCNHTRVWAFLAPTADGALAYSGEWWGLGIQQNPRPRSLCQALSNWRSPVVLCWLVCVILFIF